MYLEIWRDVKMNNQMTATTASVLGILGVFGLLAILSAGGCVQQTDQLSGSFTVKWSGDFSSSGAGRSYHASLAFKDNGLVGGWAEYEVSPGTGGSYTKRCAADTKTLTWVDNETGGKCGIDDYTLPPLDKTLLQEKINSGEYKSLSSEGGCPHDEICYEIEK